MEKMSFLNQNDASAVIDKITVDYHRITKIKPTHKRIDAICDTVIWEYAEQLVMDRKTQTMEYTQIIGSECKVSHKYEIPGGIGGLFEKFEAVDLFLNIKDESDDFIEDPNEITDYKITVDYRERPQRVIQGRFDKNGLPEDFAYFAETVFSFSCFYGVGEIFTPSLYGKQRRRRDDFIFCSVVFDNGYKSYYYLTDDDSIAVGDSVIVPAGKDNHEAVVEVVNIEYFSQENAPLPVEKIKRIIRKYTDTDEIP